ncbi:MAG: carbamoyltransferase C-terminal domain-containing protein [Prochlorococcus marinus]
MNVILGFSNTHNGSVALICDGKVKVAIQAERISRKKRQSLPLGKEIDLTHKCVEYCLSSSGLTYKDLNAVALSTPWRLHQISNEKLFHYIGGIPEDYLGTFYVPHHLSHMEYILHYGNMEPGIVLVIDGSGSMEGDRFLFNIKEDHHPQIINHSHFSGKEVISAYLFDGFNSSLIYRYSPSQSVNDNKNSNSTGFLQSIGHYWEWASLYCCGSKNAAGKVMGLAAFGEGVNPNEKDILTINDWGELKLDFSKINKLYNEPNIFGSDLSNSKHHQDLANRVQLETENVILKLLNILKNKFPSDNLYLSGGVALNVVANERIKQSKLFKKVILNGSVEDNGTAIGAGIATYLNMGYERKISIINDYYGRLYDENHIINAISKYNLSFKILTENELFKIAAKFIQQEKIIGWFQGRSEFGPRALGNRSILANPSSVATKYILDHYMKCRDRYRPYAPVVIEEKVNKYFDTNESSPVMMRNVNVLDKNLLAIKHIDDTARVQTVNQNQNRRLYQLLLEVENFTGIPVLLNTSFNRPGEPIVESPNDALSSFSEGSLDYLFIENIFISR